MADQPTPAAQAESTSELLCQLSDQMSTLVHKEIELAKAEVTVKGKPQASAPGCSAAPELSASTQSAR